MLVQYIEYSAIHDRYSLTMTSNHNRFCKLVVLIGYLCTSLVSLPIVQYSLRNILVSIIIDNC